MGLKEAKVLGTQSKVTLECLIYGPREQQAISRLEDCEPQHLRERSDSRREKQLLGINWRNRFKPFVHILCHCFSQTQAAPWPITVVEVGAGQFEL
jgi:hypothetical protein